MNYTQEKNELSAKFDRQLATTMALYGSSKMNNDGVVEQELLKINQTIKDLQLLYQSIVNDIGATSMLIQAANPPQPDDPSDTTAQDNANTANQMMKDSKTLYDKDRILLFIKIGIVLLILVKGNPVYTEYKGVFVGASLTLIFAYLMFLRYF